MPKHFILWGCRNLSKGSKLPSVKKSISLREDLFEYAMDQADKLHSGYLSAYLAHLVSCDMRGTETNKLKDDEKPEKKATPETKNRVYETSEESKKNVDKILGTFNM